MAYESYITAELVTNEHIGAKAVEGLVALERLLSVLRSSSAQSAEYWPPIQQLSRLIGYYDGILFVQAPPKAAGSGDSEPPRSAPASGPSAGCQLPLPLGAADGSEDYGWGI